MNIIVCQTCNTIMAYVEGKKTAVVYGCCSDACRTVSRQENTLDTRMVETYGERQASVVQ